MSREIKFRAWHKDLSHMMVSEGNEIHFYFCVFTYPSMYDLMQFTGLLDKNGKEIYEGDILRQDNLTITIKYKANAFVGVSTNSGNIIEHRNYFQWEKIGNIHENPELR